MTRRGNNSVMVAMPEGFPADPFFHLPMENDVSPLGTIADAGDNGLDFTLHGNAYVADGVFVHPTTGNDGASSPVADFHSNVGTVSLWLYANYWLDSQYARILTWPNAGSYWGFMQVHSNKVTWCNFAGGNRWLAGADVWATGVWEHWVGTWRCGSEGADGRPGQELWRNGELYASGAGIVDIPNTTSYVNLGSRRTGRPWNGMVAHPAMWKRRLTTDEIAYLYAMGPPSKAWPT